MRKYTSLILLLAIAWSINAQQYDLKLDLKKGQHYMQSMVIDMNMNQNMGGQDITITTRMQFDIRQTVKSISADGDYNLESEYSRIAVTADAMGQKMSFDSKVKDTTGDPSMKVYAGAFDKIIGKKFTVTLSPKGKVKGIKGLKEIIEALKDKDQDPTAQKLIEGSFDESKMKSNYESAYHIYPDSPVKVGDSWKSTTNVESIFPMEFNTGYTLKEVSNGIAKVVVTGNFNVKKDDYEVSGMTMKVNFDGTYDGTYDLDIQTGMNNNSDIAMPMKGTMEVMGMEMPVSIRSTMKSSTTPND